MIPEAIFRSGLKAVFQAKWNLLLKTPLCIKSGSRSAFNPGSGGNKTRNVQMSYDWNVPSSTARTEFVEISEARFEVRLQDGIASPCYSIPAGSFRGALRSWSLIHLVREPKLRNVLNEPDQKEGAPDLRVILDSDSGLTLLSDIFGVAAEKEEGGEESLSRTGRMRVDVSHTANGANGLWVQGNDWSRSSRFGPENLCRHISVRGPVDRITHGARVGGLHYFLEFSPGERLNAVVRLVNPSPHHFGLVLMWEREINAGTLRFGGLSSIGRGRLEVDHSQYMLFALPGYEKEWDPQPPAGPGAAPADVLSRIWQPHILAPDGKYVEALRTQLNF
ncbi:MAG: hypothetical protein C4530_09200 [Desulfobacteraceae bacterium]|nr:MAG: hypothetical protein C4530_09200 [Desulfobacteraceae bacterium]